MSYIVLSLSNPVNGMWGDWNEYDTCSRTCGAGNQSRSRDCNNPTPDHGGLDCIGNASQTQVCNMEVCPGKFFYFELVDENYRFTLELSNIAMKTLILIS